MHDLTDDDRARLEQIARQIEYTIKDADWPEFEENDPADPMRDVRFLRKLAQQSSGDQGLRSEDAIEAAAAWLREAEQAHPGPMGAPYAQLQPPQRKEPYRKRARSLLAFVRPALEEEMRKRVRAIPKEDGIAAGFLRRRTVEAALSALTHDKQED